VGASTVFIGLHQSPINRRKNEARHPSYHSFGGTPVKTYSMAHYLANLSAIAELTNPDFDSPAGSAPTAPGRATPDRLMSDLIRMI
jgi:hypothetical protein